VREFGDLCNVCVNVALDDIRLLLTYSAVCGIGLDTVPISGDIPIDKISVFERDDLYNYAVLAVP
jgi:uncharacterized protein (UPF0210 family)